MISVKRLFASVGFLLSVALPAAAEVQWAPFLNAELYGGMSSFADDDDSPVSGPNGSLLFVPGMRLGENLSLLPSFTADYKKTRDVQELAGGGFLTQEQGSLGAAVKGIYSLSPSWKAKASAGYRQQLVKETSDEDWGDGLFDYNKTAAGLELERQGSTWRSHRFGLDAYSTKFPNFQSLASKELGSEINAGTDVLDFNALDISWGADLALGQKAMLSSYLLASSRDYGDQKLVRPSGLYADDTRQDMFTYLSLGYRRQLPTTSLFHTAIEQLAGLDFTYAALDSNQDNFDAKRLKFNDNYYDYSEWSLGPRLNFRFQEKLTLGLGYVYAQRDYADRPTQAANTGAYQTDVISTKTSTFRWSLGYPLMKNIGVTAQGAFQSASSNMDYETVYQYNYTSANYFLGLSYQL